MAAMLTPMSAVIITANWEADSNNRWTLSVGGGVGRVFKIGDQPVNAQLNAYYNVVTPDDIGANWQLRAQFTGTSRRMHRQCRGSWWV
jgi:hypothetical protein